MASRFASSRSLRLRTSLPLWSFDLPAASAFASPFARNASSRQCSQRGSGLFSSSSYLTHTSANNCSYSQRALRSFSTSSSFNGEKRYTEEHEWIELNEDGTEGTIGISEYAAKALGDVVYVELPEVDLEVNAGDSMGAVESVKSASDIYSPVCGTIIEGNKLLETKPGTINQAPEGNGWIAKIKLSEGESENVADYMDAKAYAEFTE